MEEGDMHSDSPRRTERFESNCFCTEGGQKSLLPEFDDYLRDLRHSGITRTVQHDDAFDAREAYNAAAARGLETNEDDRVVVMDLKISPDVNARMYVPQDIDRQPGQIVFFHGGGWVLGNTLTHDGLCRRLSSSTHMVVLSLDYPLAPEHPFPSALNAADLFVASVMNSVIHPEIGEGPTVLAGDSAGGALAAAVARRRRDRGETGVDAQVLIYPVTDYRFTDSSFKSFGANFGLTTEDMQWFWGKYLAAPSDAYTVDASPLAARDLTGLPPTIIVVAGCDPLHDQGVEYARRLAESGVSVSLQCCRGAIHGFMRQVNVFPSAATELDTLGKSLHDKLNR